MRQVSPQPGLRVLQRGRSPSPPGMDRSPSPVVVRTASPVLLPILSPHLPAPIAVPRFVAPVPQFFMPPTMAYRSNSPVPSILPQNPAPSVPLPDRHGLYPIHGARCAQECCLPGDWPCIHTRDDDSQAAQPSAEYRTAPEYRNLFSSRENNATFPSPDSFKVSEELDRKLWRAASFYAQPPVSATDHVTAAQQALAEVRAGS